MAGFLELTRRAADELDDGAALEPEAVFRWARGRLGHLVHEEVWVFGVTSKSRIQSIQQVGRGGLAGCSLLPRDILGPLMREGAAAFVLVHNHPSGDPEPSDLDVDMTRELAALSSRLGVPLLDHLVVTREHFVSMLREGYLSPHQRLTQKAAPRASDRASD
jgi:DNA repair protein RadC